MRALVLLVACAGLTGLLAAATPRAHAIGPCTDVQIVGLRGSSEAANGSEHDMGSLLGPLADQIAERASGAATISFYGVPYPASRANPGTVLDGEYYASKNTGSAMLHDYLRAEIASCPATKLVVMGYSQGAHAAGDQLAKEPSSVTNHVSALVMFGDPRFNPAASYDWGTFDPRDYGIAGIISKRPTSDFGSWSSRVFSFCNQNDVVCQGIGIHHGTAAHEQAAYLSADGPVATGLVSRRLGLPKPASSKTPLDLAFVIDSTGSMASSIDGVERSAQAIAADLAAKGSDFRLGLVDYKDTDQGDPYGAQVDLDMTSDAAAFSNSVGSLGAYGGGDYPEAVYSGLMTAITQLHWRATPRKAIIVMGDAPAKDPEPVTGYTRQSVLDAARNLDPATVFPVAVGDGPADDFQALADGSGGQVFHADDPGGVADEITAAVDKAAVPLYVGLTAGTPARPGSPVEFSAADSYYDDGAIVSYAWDFDGDGTADATTTDNRATHVYDAPFNGIATVTVTTDDSHTATATAAMDIRDDAAVPAGAPRALRVTAGGDGKSMNVSWEPPSDLGGGSLLGYELVVADAATGEPVRSLTTDPGSTTSGTIGELDPRSYDVAVVAVTDAGAGSEALGHLDLTPSSPSSTSSSASAQVQQQGQQESQSPPAPGKGHRRAARLRVVHAFVRNGKLDLLAKIDAGATGNLRVSYRSAGRTLAFTVRVRSATIRFKRRLTRRQRAHAGLLSLTYMGNASVEPSNVRARARPSGRRHRR